MAIINGTINNDNLVGDTDPLNLNDENLIEDFRGAQGDRIDVSALGIAELETIRAIAINNINGSAYLSTNFNGGTTNLTVQGLSLEVLTSNNNNFAFSSSIDISPDFQTGEMSRIYFKQKYSSI